jgi:DNA-binding CsgD family transcriptional regulator
MDLRRALLRLFGYNPPPRLTFPVEMQLVASLEQLARREERDAEELAAELLAEGVEELLAHDERVDRWRRLSDREQQVTALICLGYAPKQIAYRLYLSPDTVKTYLRNVLRKFGVHNQKELRKLLSDWNFSAWEL